MKRQNKPKFEFYVLNYDPNAKKVVNYNIFNNSIVYEETLEEVEKYCKNPNEYCYSDNISRDDSYIYGFKAFYLALSRIIKYKEWSRREYEIFVGDAFEDDLKKFEKWDCWYQALPNIKVIAREVIRAYEEWLGNNENIEEDSMYIPNLYPLKFADILQEFMYEHALGLGGKWIPVKESTPDNYRMVLINLASNDSCAMTVTTGCFYKGQWYELENNDEKKIVERVKVHSYVTAWRELPESYKNKSDIL